MLFNSIALTVVIILLSIVILVLLCSHRYKIHFKFLEFGIEYSSMELPAAAAAAAVVATSAIAGGDREALLYVCFINLRCMN